MPDTLPPLVASDVTTLHDRLLAGNGWPQQEPADAAEPHELFRWVQANHRFNSLLWAEEDLARRTTVADAEIAANKRAIDGFNQARNEATERVDEWLLVALGLVDAASARTDSPVSKVPADARLNSETAGSMVDRMSIMALKTHAMREQGARADIDDAHRSASAVKLARLEQQRSDLAACLDAISRAGINVQEMSNTVFEGSAAAVARISLEQPPDAALLDMIRAGENVLDASVVTG